MFDPLNNLRMNLPPHFTYHIDSFCGKPARMIGIIANVPFRNVDWTTTEEVQKCETECDTEVRTTVKVKPVLLDFQMMARTRETKVISIFGTIAAASTVSGEMLRICHNQALKDECKIGDGIFVSMKELYRTGTVHDYILRTHEDYINSHASVEFRGVDIHDLAKLATPELCQLLLNNNVNDFNNITTKLDLLKCFIMQEQQTKATQLMHYFTAYSHPVIKHYSTAYSHPMIKIHFASQHIHTVYEATNALEESHHQHHFFHSSIASTFSPTCRSYLATADDRAPRAAILQTESKR